MSQTKILHIMGPNGIGKSTVLMKIGVHYLGVRNNHNQIPSASHTNAGIYFSEDNRFAIIGKVCKKNGEVNMRHGEVSGCTKEELLSYIEEAQSRGTQLIGMQGQMVNSMSAVRRNANAIGEENYILVIFKAPYKVISQRKHDRTTRKKTMKEYDELSIKQNEKFERLIAKVEQELPNVNLYEIDTTKPIEDVVSEVIDIVKENGITEFHINDSLPELVAPYRNASDVNTNKYKQDIELDIDIKKILDGMTYDL